jgi:hypothetical protein
MTSALPPVATGTRILPTTRVPVVPRIHEFEHASVRLSRVGVVLPTQQGFGSSLDG